VQEMTKLITVTRNFDGLAAGMAEMDSSTQDAIKVLGGQS